MIVFLTEEESMKVTLEIFISRFWPAKIPGVDWIALSFRSREMRFSIVSSVLEDNNDTNEWMKIADNEPN
ncbi:MAG: hypothetical protein RL240_2896 [Planctomycetota bacterium]|jgi:hypothetical protein